MVDPVGLSGLISKTFSHVPDPQIPGAPIKVPNDMDKATANKRPEISRESIPINTAANVQAVVWGSGPIPPSDAPVGALPAQDNNPQPSAPPAKVADRGTVGQLSGPDKGWGKLM